MISANASQSSTAYPASTPNNIYPRCWHPRAMLKEYSWLDIYSSLLTLVFVFYAPLEIWILRGASIKVLPGFQGHGKTILGVVLFLTQLVSLLASTSLANGYRDQVQGIASTLAAFELCILLRFGHRRTVRPSTTVLVYVSLSLINDIIALTLPSGNLQSRASLLLIVRAALEAGILVAESQSKFRTLMPQYKCLTPEERTGAFGRVLFWWINPVLRKGYRDVLSSNELHGIDRALHSRVLRERMIRAWKERPKPETRFTLLLVLFRGFKKEFLSPILPRLLLIVFRYAQPMLIGVTIEFVQHRHARESLDSGYWLVILTGIIYCGLAISTSMYKHRLNKLQLIVRAALVSLIHASSLMGESSPIPNGKALTLMSTDVDSVDTSAELVHETWAQLVEVLIGTTLLTRHIGWFSLLPLVIIFGCSRMSAYVAKHLQGRQKDWSVATQRRLTMVASVLGGVKSMKILGLEKAIECLISSLRAQEIAISKRLRWIMVAYNASANALGIFSPVLTLVLFALFGKGDAKLNPDTVFTSIALLALVTHPANMVMTLIPRAVASLANFERIQAYLTKGSFLDRRVLVPLNTADEADYKLETGQRLAILIENATIQPPTLSSHVLQDVDFRMNRGSIFMCSGPVSSGKSVLALTILGEIAPREGKVVVTDEPIGFCSQSTWLPTGSIQDVICQGAKVEQAWYKTVIEACGLRTDLESLPDKDKTWIGSGGINLSGGQKSRIALARAVYSRASILVLDDPFSALDGEVESHVAGALLGPRGILRQAHITVFLIAHSAQYYALADKVILLDDERAQTLDPQDKVVLARERISKLTPPKSKIRNDESQTNSPTLADRKRMDDAAADMSRRTGDLALYGYYFGSVGTLSMLLMASCTAIYAFCLTFSQYVLKWWTESTAGTTWPYILAYFLLSLMAWVATNGTMWSTHILIALKSGSRLHSRLLGRIMNAPLSYFSSFEVGSILNRFGQDIQLVDKQLPPAFSNLSTQIFKLLMQAIVLFTVQPLMAVTLPFCAVDGIATIRAFGWEREFELDNINKLDASQSPLYLLLCLQRWLNVVLDLLIAGIALLLVSSAVALRNTATGAEIGVALNMVIAANTTLLRLVENWTSLETSLGAVSRLRSIDQNTPSEDKEGEFLEPGPQWPSAGSVRIKRLSAGYTSKALVLRDLNLDIRPGQTVVLCGRTGSGKSTLFLALLRLLDLETGSIELGDVDIAHLSVHTVRRRGFIAVPQDPFLLPDASLRFNLDPYREHHDAAIAQILKRTGLWAHLSRAEIPDVLAESSTTSDDTDTPDIFDKPLSTFPPLSSGQRKMLALAQALLRVQSRISSFFNGDSEAKPVVILDEASSSLDPETEDRMQELVQTEVFDKGLTVIMISHRDGNMQKGLRPGFDAVIWLRNGKVCVDSDDVVDGGCDDYILGGCG